ncbi:hypothetical protein BDR22DRAFT_850210 [Usnea florida]
MLQRETSNCEVGRIHYTRLSRMHLPEMSTERLYVSGSTRAELKCNPRCMTENSNKTFADDQVQPLISITPFQSVKLDRYLIHSHSTARADETPFSLAPHMSITKTLSECNPDSAAEKKKKSEISLRRPPACHIAATDVELSLHFHTTAWCRHEVYILLQTHSLFPPSIPAYQSDLLHAQNLLESLTKELPAAQ